MQLSGINRYSSKRRKPPGVARNHDGLHAKPVESSKEGNEAEGRLKTHGPPFLIMGEGRGEVVPREWRRPRARVLVPVVAGW